SRGARRPSGHDVEGRAAGEKLEDPLEILRAVERDLQLAFHAASPLDADVRSERTLQLLLELTLGRVARLFLPRATTRRTLRSLDLGLAVADAPPLLDRAPRELRNDAVVLRPEQRAGMPCRQAVLPNENAYAGRQLEQTDRIGDGRSVLPHDVRDLLLRDRNHLAQALVRLRLLESVKQRPLAVLDGPDDDHGAVVARPHDGRNLRPPQPGSRAPPPHPGHDLPARAGTLRRPHDNRLQQPVGLERCRKVGELLFGELAARLKGVRTDVGNAQAAGDRKSVV